MSSEKFQAKAKAFHEGREAARARLRAWDCDNFVSDLKTAKLYRSPAELVRAMDSPDFPHTVALVDCGTLIAGWDRSWTVLRDGSGYKVWVTRIQGSELSSEPMCETRDWLEAFGRPLNDLMGNGFGAGSGAV